MNVHLRYFRRFFFGLILILALGAPVRLVGQPVFLAPTRENGIYEPGETVHWKITSTNSLLPKTARVRILRGGLTEIATSEVTFSNGVAFTSAQFRQPGALLAEVQFQTDDGRQRKAVGGALAAPEKIQPAAARPRDFDRFWNSKLREQKRLPLNPRLESTATSAGNVEISKLTLDNIWNTKIRGYFARPQSRRKPLPALLIVQWAGVYKLEPAWSQNPARQGWMVLNTMAHDLPVDEPAEFYREQSQGPLRNYGAIGNTNRETSYFLRMYLGAYRAAEYLAQHPDWDGKTLVVMGVSQGGMQSLVTAALHPRISAAIAHVPAGCDTLGPEIGRKDGWPWWFSKANPPEVREASRYFDVVNFARRIDCPVLIGIGLRDEICPPEGIFAAVNLIRSPKEIVTLPRGGHSDERGTHAAFEQRRDVEWLPRLLRGEPPPILGDE